MWAMLYKARTKSDELLILESLNTRMELSNKDKQHYFNLNKGYEGEVLFDTWTEKLQCDCLIINDLLLKMNNTMFQIDTLLIFLEMIYVFEVKNIEGDFYYESDRIYKKPNFEILNPINQLNRSESLLRQLLHDLSFPTPINSSIVFINPEFTLYQAPIDKPFIFPTQINKYMNKLNKFPTKINQKQRLLAEKLVSLHIKDSPYTRLPKYNYSMVRKGHTCKKCSSFTITVVGRKCICEECGHVENIEAAVLRNVNEFKLLFPEEKITTNVIHDWCQVITDKRRINRILKKNFNIVGVHQWSFYE